MTYLWLQRVGRDEEILGRGSLDPGPSSRLQLSVMIKMTNIYWATTVCRVPHRDLSEHFLSSSSQQSCEHLWLWIIPFMKKEMEKQRDEHLPKVTECTHSPDLTAHCSHSTSWPDRPLQLTLTSSSWRWHPSGTGAGDFALFSVCTRKDGKELWRQPTQKVENKANPEPTKCAWHPPTSWSHSFPLLLQFLP